MKKAAKSWIFLATSLLVAQTSPDTKKDSYHFNVSEVTRIDVNIDYGLGELTVGTSGDDNAIEGTIEYDPYYVTPEVKYRETGSKGKLDVSVESTGHQHHDDNEWSFNFKLKAMKGKDYQSAVEFRLPPSIPLDIDMDFGLGDADIDLSGLDISEFKLNCGLSDVKVTADTPNPGKCETISIESGLGDFNGRQLGNLRTEDFHMEVGLGSATVDLTGAMIGDMEGDITVGLGSLDLLLPKNANIRLEVEDTFLSSVDVNDLVKDGDDWVTPHWDDGLPTVELQISVGLGSVDVEVE